MNEHGCSRAQSYRYVSDAMSVFGNPVQSKEAEKAFREELIVHNSSIKIKMKATLKLLL
jgi:hypothetical protein